MLILAIDPGPEESAWVLWDGTYLHGFAKEPSAEVLSRISYQRWDGAQPTDCVIEKICSYGMAVGAEIFETVFWSGRFAQAARPDGNVARVPRLEVKLWLCHDSRAKDANIRQAIIDRFGGKDATRKGGSLHGVSGDVWAALAVALTYHEKYVLTGVAA